MTSHDLKQEALRAAIAELRGADERAVPPFAAVLARRRVRTEVLWRPGRLVLAAAVVLVVSAALAYSARPRRLTVPSEIVALSVWRPATDALLETSVSNLLRETPRLSASLVNVNMKGELR